MIRLEKRQSTSKYWLFLSPNLAILLSLLGGALLFAALGYEPLTTLEAFFITPISDLYGLTELAIKTTPLVLIALGLMVAYTANVWNIGAEGQYLAGAICGTAVAMIFYEVESWWVLPLMFLGSMLGGMLWASIPAILKNRYNVNEILSSLMLNYVAFQLLLFMTNGPLRDPDGINFPESRVFHDGALLPILLEDTRLNFGIVIALLFVAIFWVFNAKSLFGFKTRVYGQAPLAAKYAGFKESGIILTAFLISGSMAGVAGFTEISGPAGQLTSHFSTNYGYTAIIVAFLGRLHPIGILLGGLIIGLSTLGGESAQIDLGMPLAVTGVFQGMLLFFLLACDLLRTHQICRIKK